jgi:hypothetical protein
VSSGIRVTDPAGPLGASSSSSTSNAPQNQSERQLEQARREAARIREDAREQGAMIIDEMRQQAQDEASRIVDAAAAQIDAERRRALRDQAGPLRRPPSGSDNVLVLTGLMGDDGPVADLIGISGDARALAALLASRALSPPIAVGLYGEWGSGKTFFMRQIEVNVRELSRPEFGGRDFCPNVAHIWFNAWHYAEGNLWASLVDQIFSVLGQRPSRYQELLRGSAARRKSPKPRRCASVTL